jgi:hypothetical protein
MDAEKGQLKVSMPDIDSVIRPTVNVIDSETLALVETVQCDELVEMVPGKYVVSSTLPSGERSVAVANVTAGATEEVELVAVDGPSSPGVDGSPPPQIGRLFMRYLCSGRNGVTLADADTELARVSNGGNAVDLTLRAGTYDGVLFAQFATAGEVPLSVGLPINSATRSAICHVTVTSHPLTASVTLPESPLVDAVARYLYTGNLQQAASVAATADALLDQDDPFGAALGGYALLRLGELELLGAWPEGFARSFAWLPDSAIVAGAAAALEDDHVRAAAHYCDAAERGMPAFVDGFSMLLSGLREYDDANTPPGVPPELAAAAGRHANRLLPVGALIDYARISLAVHGVDLEDPANSQERFPGMPTGDGWRLVGGSAG